MSLPPKAELNEALRWIWGHNPNPPDPWLPLIIEMVDPTMRQAVVGEIVRLNVATAMAQAQFWTGMQKVVGGAARE